MESASAAVKKYRSCNVLDLMMIYQTVDGRNPAPPGIYKPCKSWDKVPTSTGETAEFLNQQQYVLGVSAGPDLRGVLELCVVWHL